MKFKRFTQFVIHSFTHYFSKTNSYQSYCYSLNIHLKMIGTEETSVIMAIVLNYNYIDS